MELVTYLLKNCDRNTYQSKTLYIKESILLPKLFWPTVRKKSSDRETILKFEVGGQEFGNFLRSLEQFV